MDAQMTKETLQERIRTEHRAALVVNTRSRHGAQLATRAVRQLEAAGLSVSSYFVRNPDYLRKKIHEAMDAGHCYIIIGGGDGTISSVSGIFAHRNLVLGVLPLGTGNSFARSLGIALSLEGALDVLVHGKVADIDLGRAGTEYFVNIVDIGISAEMAWQTTRMLKRVLGILAYLLVGVRVGWHHHAFLARFTRDSEIRELRTHEIIIANGHYYGESELTNGASVESRRLVVFTMDAMTRWQLTRLWLAFLLDKRVPLAGVAHFTTDDVLVETEPPQYLDIDGESTVRTPTRFTVDPNALYVMVPPGFEDR